MERWTPGMSRATCRDYPVIQRIRGARMRLWQSTKVEVVHDKGASQARGSPERMRVSESRHVQRRAL